MRDYSEIPFNSIEWHRGDPVERGRMIRDIYGSRVLAVKSRKEVEELLGKPEKKQRVEGREVWLYRVELPNRSELKYLPVSFEGYRKTFPGKVKDGAISILVEK
ncbi:MAG: hypothetical protein HKN25_15680 [Pyrinomonadaceae bacterium]|nr:hypothetical protein [Pyrinomonadaceae bacterium]